MGNGERGGKYRSDAPCSSFWPTQRRHERSGIRSVSGVVPQGRLAKGLGVTVQHDHAMLLRRDRDRSDLCGAPRFVEGSRHGHLPGNGVGLACSAIALYFVAGCPRGHDAAVIEVDHEDLGRLRRTINSRNERHGTSFPDVPHDRRR
jgi:hypothetical protein